MVDERTLSTSQFSRSAMATLAETGNGSVVRGISLLVTQAVLVCALIAAGYLALPWLKVNFDKPIKRVQVHGDWQVLNQKTIENAIVIYDTDTFLNIDLDALVKHLEDQPWIARARARRQWPDTVSIDIIEETPIAYWGDRWMVNAKGRIFEHQGLYQNKPLPHLWSAVGTPVETMNYYQVFEHQLQAVDLRLRGISQNLQGDWRLLLDNGLQVVLGGSDPASSIRYFVGIYQQVLQPSERQAVTVDMRYRHGAAIQWQQVATKEATRHEKNNAGEKT